MRVRRVQGHALAIVAALLTAACGDGARTGAPSPSEVLGSDAHAPAPAAAGRGGRADPTANLRIAQTIRRAIVADETLTTPPRRIKVLADDRAVTLRGAVDSAADRERIAETARRIAGPGAVTDELSVVRTAGEPDSGEPPA